MKFAFLLLVLAMVAPGAVSQTQPKPKRQKPPKPEMLAQRAADPWLVLIDEGKYAQSWQTSAQFFQSHISEGQWQSAVAEVRGPLGPLQMRKLKSAKFSTTLPGMPDGKYVVLEYQSTFVNKQSSVETISSMMEKDGAWRVSGYFVR